jgi:hypothetical protein
VEDGAYDEVEVRRDPVRHRPTESTTLSPSYRASRSYIERYGCEWGT